MARHGDFSPQDRKEDNLPQMKNQMNTDKTQIQILFCSVCIGPHLWPILFSAFSAPSAVNNPN
jgi:hypothetical protein